MRSKTQAIVLHLTRHSDSMSILNLYTRDFGRVDYIIYGAGGKKNKFKKSLLEPLSMLNVEVDHNPTKDLQRIEDIQLIEPNHQIATDIRKRCICMFVSEILYRTLRHPMTDEQLFDFLILSIQTLEQCREPQNFHLSFLVRLTQFLGFYPKIDSKGEWLDMRTGEKQYGLPFHPDVMTMSETEILESIIASEDIAAADVRLTRDERVAMLERMITYYQLHLESFYPPKSLDILSAIFDD